MKHLSICALLSLLGAPLAAHGADARPAKPSMDVNVPPYQLDTKVFDFPTGLRIMMQSDRSHPVATAWMLVNHGSADDPKGKEETAHFVEHTWFRSKHGDLPPVMDVIQDLGTLFNATTRNDWTDYRTVASSEYLPMLLRLESLRLTEFYEGVTEEEIDVEREVIRNEWRRRNEQSESLFVDYLYEAVYPEDHGYHDHSTHESIDNIKLADLQGYVDQYYKPENTTIFVVGDFSAEPGEAASLIFQNFDLKLLHPDLTSEMLYKYPRPGIEEPDQANPDHWLVGAWDPATFDSENPEPFKFVTRTEPRITEQRPPVPQVGSTEVRTEQGPFDYKTVVVGWSLPGGYRSDHYDLVIVGNIASQYVASAFWEERNRRQIRDVGCFAQPELRNTTVACYAELRDEDLDPLRVRDKMLDQLSEIWNPENFTPNTFQGQLFRQQFQRSKMEGLADILLSLDLFALQFGGRAELIAPHAHYTGSPKAHTEGMERLMGADAAKISKIAYEHLKRDRAATVILEPLDEEDIDIGSENSTYRGANATDQVVRSSDDLSQVTDEQIAAAYIEPDLSDLVDFTLDNGVRVVILPHGEAPMVQASVLLGRNASEEPKGFFDFLGAFSQSVGHDPLPIAASPNFAVFPGTPGLSAGLSKPFWIFGGEYGNGLRLDYQAPAGNLDGALWMLREELENAKPYIDSKPAYIKDERTALKILWTERSWHINRVTDAYLYPGSDYYRETRWEDIDAMEAWGASDIDTWLGSHLRPDNATLVIVGNIDPEKAKEYAQTYFGGWKPRNNAGEKPKPLSPPDMPADPSKIVIFDDPSRTQTQVTTSCRLNFTDEEQEIAIDVLSSLLGTRTFSQLRVKEGLAYSPGAYSGINSDGSARLVFYSLATNSGVGRTVQFFQEAVEEVEAGKVAIDEVKLHKLRRARQDGVASQSMDQMTGTLTEVLRADKDWAFATDRGELIAGVNPDELKELVQGCGEHMITTLEGPKDVLTPQLDELGYEYEVFEWDAYGSDLLWKHDPKAAKKREKDRLKQEKKDAKKAKKEGEKGDGDGGEESADASHP